MLLIFCLYKTVKLVRNQSQESGATHSGWKTVSIAMMLVLALSTSPAWTAPPTSDVNSQIDDLQQQIDQLKASYGTLGEPTGNSIQQTNGEILYTPPQLNTVFPPCPPAKNPDFPTAQLTGFMQIDTGWFEQDDANKAVLGDIQNGADFRRARLAAVGEVWENVGYMLEMDFAAGGRPSFMDVWFEIKNDEAGNVRIGQFRQPFGMDGQTSIKDISFLERGLPFAFLPFRQIGMMYYGNSEVEDTTWAVSGFRFPTDPFGGNIGDSGGYGGAARLTRLLIDHGDDGVVHVGAGYVYIDPANDFVQYQNQPEFFVSETGGSGLVPQGVPNNVPPFVDTGAMPTEHVNLINAEFGASAGPLHTQAEVFYSMLSRLNGSSVTFNGAYAQAGYVLTGESRAYNRKAGVFGRVVPDNPFGRSGIGAWEVAARWSYIDLNDEDIQGGRLNDTTLGLNWYLNKFTKVQFNYIHAFLNSSSATYGPIVKDSDADIIAIRGQVDF
ncbi:Porin O precursor [Polystyrenella longa]|uniref:Porin O n=1 Tax=Polystyrenella longa TaxID=2528007 RepID=A0A518CSK9_9PLAN|nr:porin [Polystyrenella longa]QDU82221.1 Porin O precursor [Polystyrenella longa]